MNDPIYDDHYLFQQVAKGDEAAFTQLFHSYTPKLFPFITRFTRNDTIARELVQETFLQLWKNRTELDKVNQPSSWIFRIAANVSISWLRAKGRQQRMLSAVTDSAIPGDTDMADNLEAKELTGIIHRAVDLLPEKRQEIYRLSREHGLTHQQIAEKLDLSQNTVKNQIGIALKFIHEHIKRETGLSIITIAILLS